jgi:hypothetical protein
MPACRTVILFFAGIALGPTPACISTSKTVSTIEPAVAKSPKAGEFAIYPKRPGEVIRKNSESTATAEKPLLPSDGATTAPLAPVPPVNDANVVTAADPASLPIAIPSTGEPELVAALRAFLDNRPETAIQLLQPLERPNQDYALAVMPLLVRGSQIKMSSASADEIAVLVQQLHAIAGRLESKAALRVEKVAFCRKVTGFGRFEPWSEGQPYRPNDLAVLYLEVRNVGSEPAPGPHGETFLSRAAVSLEVRDATGNLVEQTDPTDWRRRVPVARFEQADHTRSPLHDYSRTYRISVPAQPGVYTVTVEVKDPIGNRVARSQPVRFDVAGP